MRKTVKSMVDEAMAAVKSLGVEQAQGLHGRDDVQFIDIRDVRELEREGVIPGAFHAPRGMLEFWVDPESPYHKPLFAENKQFVLFCAMGWRSALATKTLQEMGVPNVAHIDGGFSAWKEAGLPVEQKAAQKEAKPAPKEQKAVPKEHVPSPKEHKAQHDKKDEPKRKSG